MDPVVHHTLRIGVRLLFFFALWHKTQDFREFKETVTGYRVVSSGLVPVVAGGIVLVESIVVLFGDAIFVLGLGGGLLLAYAVLIAVNLVRGVDRIDCGCVGLAGRERLSWWLVARNVVCAVAAFALLVPQSGRALEWLDWYVVAAGSAALVGLYIAADALIANAPAYRRLREAV